MPDSAPVEIFRIQFVAIAASVLFVGAVLALVRRGRLREEYALIWLSTTLAMLVLSVRRDWLERAAVTAGIAYAPALLFLVLLGGALLMLVHFSVALTRTEARLVRITQELALLRLERAADAARDPDQSSPEAARGAAGSGAGAKSRDTT